MIRIVANQEKISKQRLIEFEKTIGYKLPEDYFEFLLNKNGGKPELNLCTVAEYGQITVSYFFGLDLNDKGNEFNNVLSVFFKRIPDGYIPIAAAEGGNLICLALSGNAGAVYLWNHEEESEEGEQPTMRNMLKITDNFSIFLDILEKFDAKKVEVKKEDIISAWIDPDFLKEIQKK